MSFHEFLRCTGNLFHYLVCCKCIVCPTKLELMPNRTTVPVQQNVPIQRPPSTYFEDESIYNGSSMYGVAPVIIQPKTVTHINPSGVTISAKSMTAANNEQFMHAVRVDFTCEVKGMVEVGGVPKEVKGMISIINNDNKSQVVCAVNSSLNQQTEPEYLEPIDASKNVKIINRIGPLPQTAGHGIDEGYGSEKYGICYSKEERLENIYDDIIAEESETAQADIPVSRYNDVNDPSNSKTSIQNELEKILSRQTLNASSVEKDDKIVLSSEVDGSVRNSSKSINEYYNSDVTPENNYDRFEKHNNENTHIMSPCSSWASDEFAKEPIYGNNDTILRNYLKNTRVPQSSTATTMNKEEVTDTVSNKEQNEYSPPNLGNTTHIPTTRADTYEENDENIYEDIVINAAVNQRY